MSEAVTKKLLMYSDMEGCQNENDVHSIAMCKPEFYKTLKAKMDNDKGLHVAFLGDYFDQGLHVYNSIKGMIDLHTAYKDRVIIILGNRDVNKLRFMFELTNDVKASPLFEGEIPTDEPDTYANFNKGWSAWNPYYHGLHYKRITAPPKPLDKTTMPQFTDEVGLVKHILQSSMGAGRIENGKHTGLYSFVPPGENQLSKSEEEALEYLKASLNIGGVEKKDAMKLLDFYKICKIAYVFEGDKGGKVLLSHGGGFDPDSFFSQDYVQTFYTRESVTGENYLTMLEKFRKKLSTDTPIETSQFNQSGGQSLDARSKGNEYDEIRRKYPSEPVQTSVRVYNILLRDVIAEVTQSPPLYTWKFVLLQALGLKPDVYKGSDARYNSLIQSCSQNGCLGQTSEVLSDGTNKSKTQTKKLTDILKKSGITHVSYGHKPVCSPIPLIYTRRDVHGITFISNDTSNGNRKKGDVGENTVVGTSITFNKTLDTKVEAMSVLAKQGEQDESAKTEIAPRFNDVINNTFSTINSAPEYTVLGDKTVLKYPNGAITEMNIGKPNMFAPLEIVPPPLPAGGKRRRRYSKKQRLVSKRKRSSSSVHKNKKTRRAKKARRATRK